MWNQLSKVIYKIFLKIKRLSYIFKALKILILLPVIELESALIDLESRTEFINNIKTEIIRQMPRQKKVRPQEEETAVVEKINVGLSQEQRLELAQEMQLYYAFKYEKDKNGQYHGMYFCCNCQSTMKRLVKKWKQELNTVGAGPWLLKKGQKILLPDYQDLHDYQP